MEMNAVKPMLAREAAEPQPPELPPGEQVAAGAADKGEQMSKAARLLVRRRGRFFQRYQTTPQMSAIQEALWFAGEDVERKSSGTTSSVQSPDIRPRSLGNGTTYASLDAVGAGSTNSYDPYGSLEEFYVKKIEGSRDHHADGPEMPSTPHPSAPSWKNSEPQAQDLHQDGLHTDSEPSPTDHAPPPRIRSIRKGMPSFPTSPMSLPRPLPTIKGTISTDQEKQRFAMENNPNFLNDLMHSVSTGALERVKEGVEALGDVHLASKELMDPHLGLSMLQLAIIRHQNDVIKYLLECGGEDLVLLRGETSEFQNISSLHLALMHCGSDTWIVEALLDKVSSHKRSEFVNDLLRSDFFQGLPYAELITASVIWAYAGRSNVLITERLLAILIRHGADLKLRNYSGDTFLHLVVLQSAERPEDRAFYRLFVSDTLYRLAGLWVHRDHNPHSTETFTELDQIYGMKLLLAQPNTDGLTPLALAAKLECSLFIQLTNLEKVLRFPDYKMGEEFSSVEIYDITDIRSVDLNWNYRKGSVLHQVAHRKLNLSKSQQYDLIDVEPLRTVIEIKWRTYRWFFYAWGIVHVTFMAVLTWFVFRDNCRYRPPTATSRYGCANTFAGLDATLAPAQNDMVIIAGRKIWKTDIFASLFLVVPTVYIIYELVDVFGNRPYQRLSVISKNWRMTGNGMYRVMAVLFALCMYTWYGMRLAGFVQQDVAMSLTLMLGWIFTIFFTRTVTFPRGVGAFSIMVQQMLVFDMIPFMIVSLIIHVAFSTSLHIMLLRVSSEETQMFSVTFFRIVNYFTDLDERIGYKDTRDETYSKVLVTIYALLTVILLVNMLIAAMNKSYEAMLATKINIVARQRLSILLLLERRLPCGVRRWSERSFEVAADPFGHGDRTFIKVVKHRNKQNYFQ